MSHSSVPVDTEIGWTLYAPVVDGEGNVLSALPWLDLDDFEDDEVQ